MHHEDNHHRYHRCGFSTGDARRVLCRCRDAWPKRRPLLCVFRIIHTTRGMCLFLHVAATTGRGSRRRRSEGAHAARAQAHRSQISCLGFSPRVQHSSSSFRFEGSVAGRRRGHADCFHHVPNIFVFSQCATPYQHNNRGGAGWFAIAPKRRCVLL